jgi:GNAT superfamily N-acetyltransferase
VSAPAQFTCSVAELAAAQDLAVVDAGLDQYNRAEPELARVRRLSVLARSPAGGVVGGAVGRTWGECGELLQLWVSEAQRRSGVGAALLGLFEREARARGCTLVYLTTFSFQAPGFYLRHGYLNVLETRGYTGGIARYTMHKHLRADGGVP